MDVVRFFVDSMVGNNLSSDEIIAKLIEMGFDSSVVEQAVLEVGPSLGDAMDYIFNGHNQNRKGNVATSSRCKSTLRSSFGSLCQKRQSSILEHFQSTSRPKRSRCDNVADGFVSGSEVLSCTVDEKEECPVVDCGKIESAIEALPVRGVEEAEIGSDWEERANSVLQKHFGYHSLKGFQKEALGAWVANQDCLVLAATGSGTVSFCSVIAFGFSGCYFFLIGDK